VDTNFGIDHYSTFGQLEPASVILGGRAPYAALEGWRPGPSPFEARAKWRERLRVRCSYEQVRKRFHIDGTPSSRFQTDQGMLRGVYFWAPRASCWAMRDR